MLKNKKLIYWVIAIIVIYLLYRWYKKSKTGSPILPLGLGTGGVKPLPVEVANPLVAEQEGTETDPTIARTITPIYRGGSDPYGSGTGGSGLREKPFHIKVGGGVSTGCYITRSGVVYPAPCES